MINNTYELARLQKTTAPNLEKDNWEYSPDSMKVSFLAETAIGQSIQFVEDELSNWQ